MRRQANALETDQGAADGDDDGSDADSTASWLINDEEEAGIEFIGETLSTCVTATIFSDACNGAPAFCSTCFGGA